MLLRREAQAFRLPMAGPDDASGLVALVEDGALDPALIVAILGKTEGNGCVNDFSRGYAVSALRAALGRWLDAAALDRIAMVMSGGTEGALSPHMLVLAARPAPPNAAPGPALALGRCVTRDLAPYEIGRPAQIALAAEGVRAAMADAGVDEPETVHFAQVKVPLLSAAQIAAGGTAAADTLKSMGLSRGAAALGVGVALGEIDEADAMAAAVGAAPLWSARASCSAGVELKGMEVVVLGMSPAWAGPLRIDHAVMADGLDTDPVRAALRRLGARFDGQLPPHEAARVRAVLAKAEAPRSGAVRGWRHTMLDDSDISATRHARAFAAGALAAQIGHAALFVSGGAEHQGPDGGGPCAILYDASDKDSQ
ncbi:ring-opening amidohydrolase [Rubrimonas cliftonensis]|uniref:Cyanuric acid amidohydrolase n=1 Tax=Rubrimonas cliftonensis TaxID=89524 RepID=A0A1H4AAZ5_9RHOB|nr:ring-opening amidohydrolase [Rubrimonas cliftonensis]SEA32752.1 barbiturase [Rubrimonas cliftonensis]